MTWKTTYPTVATVNEAGFTTLDTWRTHLPPPQTDVERTIQRKIHKRWLELGNQEARREVPGIMQQLDAIKERMRKAGIPLPPDCG